MKTATAAVLLCLAGCVPAPEGYVAAPQGRAMEAPSKPLDPGHKTEESAHFSLSAYTSENAARYSALAEQNYNRIMQDLGIYSFVPARPYNVLVYRDAQEYHAKTGQPDWSGGAAYGNALLLYEGPGLVGSMAHEMTHLVFSEFMGLSQAAQLRWLNEGAAVYEESRSSQEAAAFYAVKVRETVSPNPIPFSQFINLAPQAAAHQGVDRWYAQAGSVVGFMITKGGPFNFSLFLGRLRDGAEADEALRSAYPNGWKSLDELERAWLAEVRR